MSRRAGIPLFYFNDLPNFGDQLGPYLVERVYGGPVTWMAKTAGPKLLGLGSVLDGAVDGDAVWGTGVHPAYFDRYWRRQGLPGGRWRKARPFPRELFVSCVRGPLTRDCLKQIRVEVPRRMGDPALLLPLFHDADRDPKFKVALIRHYLDNAEPVPDGVKVISPLDPWREVVAGLMECEMVVSTSLHGLIVAEAMGLPATWLRTASNEGIVKYLDYYLSTGRAVSWVESLDDAIGSASMPPIPPDVLEARQCDLLDGMRDVLEYWHMQGRGDSS